MIIHPAVRDLELKLLGEKHHSRVVVDLSRVRVILSGLSLLQYRLVGIDIQGRPALLIALALFPTRVHHCHMVPLGRALISTDYGLELGQVLALALDLELFFERLYGLHY